MSLPSLPNLPQEIIAEIVTYLPTSSRLSLCLTKKVFKDACVRAIYRHIYLSGWRKIVLCCRSLVGNERAARSVRSISFDVAHFRQCLLLRAFQTLYHTALSCISPTVTSLEILSGTPLLSPCRHTFPALKTFTTTLVLCPLLTSFLSRHPTLTDLILFNNFLSPPLSLPILPNLKSFVGLADVALLLLPSSPIQHAGIAWAHAGQRTKCEQLMRIMKSVVSLIWFSTRLDAELVECLATYLGGLECLCFAGLIPIVGGRDEGLMA
ncbi:hypothetical protein BDQ17DRAFT_529032 [Cyathus striatus]|nr:hypothetical protein BDQ17DRAFT_529032 [Cyathus striatus]